MPKRKKPAQIYLLDSLDWDIRESGLHAKFASYSFSHDRTCIVMGYFDRFMNLQYIFACRTSLVCWRIFHKGKFITNTTCHATFDKLTKIVDNIIKENDYYSVMTVSEMRDIAKNHLKNDRGLVCYHKRTELRHRKNPQDT